MKIILSLILVYTSLFLHAQVLDPAKEWFELEPFFREDSIKTHHVSSIYINIQEKNDGEPIKKRSQFLFYEFNKNGALINSLKSISLNRKNDTAQHCYTYNQNNLLVRKTEIQGPFHYSYLYFYKNGLLKKEIKIDQNSTQNDTLYRRVYQSSKTDSLEAVKTLNELGKPYKERQMVYNKEGYCTKDRMSFIRNQNYNEVRYIYEQKLLREIQKDTYFQKLEKQKMSFSYLTDKLDYVIFFKEDEHIKKYAILYAESGLEKTVIERNYKESIIRIYNFYYETY
jgi:hypothetical protein